MIEKIDLGYLLNKTMEVEEIPSIDRKLTILCGEIMKLAKKINEIIEVLNARK